MFLYFCTLSRSDVYERNFRLKHVKIAAVLLINDASDGRRTRKSLGTSRAGIVVNLDSHRVDQKFEWRANAIDSVSVIINELGPSSRLRFFSPLCRSLYYLSGLRLQAGSDNPRKKLHLEYDEGYRK